MTKTCCSREHTIDSNGSEQLLQIHRSMDDEDNLHQQQQQQHLVTSNLAKAGSLRQSTSTSDAQHCDKNNNNRSGRRSTERTPYNTTNASSTLLRRHNSTHHNTTDSDTGAAVAVKTVAGVVEYHHVVDEDPLAARMSNPVRSTTVDTITCRLRHINNLHHAQPDMDEGSPSCRCCHQPHQPHVSNHHCLGGAASSSGNRTSWHNNTCDLSHSNAGPVLQSNCAAAPFMAGSDIFVGQSAWFQRRIHLRPQHRGVHLVTEEVLRQVPELTSFRVGLFHMQLLHTSASLTINENWDPDVRDDMEAAMNRVVPQATEMTYRHSCEGPDDMPAHVKACLIGSSLMLPVTEGRLHLGTWQGIWLCEHRDRAGPRKLVCTINGITTPASTSSPSTHHHHGPMAGSASAHQPPHSHSSSFQPASTVHCQVTGHSRYRHATGEGGGLHTCEYCKNFG